MQCLVMEKIKTDSPYSWVVLLLLFLILKDENFNKEEGAPVHY